MVKAFQNLVMAHVSNEGTIVVAANVSALSCRVIQLNFHMPNHFQHI